MSWRSICITGFQIAAKRLKRHKKPHAKTHREWTRIGNAKSREAKDESTYAKPTARQAADEHRFTQINSQKITKTEIFYRR
jgi:hypothetical protein